MRRRETDPRCERGSKGTVMPMIDVGKERRELGCESAYTVGEVARIFSISRSTVYREIAAGRLAATKPAGASRGYRIRKDDVRKWMRENARFIAV